MDATNVEVAAQFDEIADRLLLQGESWFKVAAYRRAAGTLRETTRDLAVLARQGELRALPGIGEAIATKIESFLETGHISMLDRLRAEQPEGLLRLLRESGFAPKQVRALANALGIDTPEALARAAGDGRLSAATSLDRKTVRAVEAWLQARQQASKRSSGQ